MPDKLHAMLSRIHLALEHNIRPLRGSTPAFILFFSFTDTKSRAQTFTVTASKFEACWIAGTEKLFQTVAQSQTDVKWLRIDWVEEVSEISNSELTAHLKQVKRNYFRYGIALDADFRNAFLETELNGNAMLYGGPSIDHAIINQANFDRYAKRTRGPNTVPVSDVENLYVFSTQAVFTASHEHAVHLIPGAGPNTGRRAVELLEVPDIDGLIERGSQFLASQIDDEGRFIYGWHPCFDKEIVAYNTLRHASTLYAMIESWEITRDEKLKAAIDRGLFHLTNKLIKIVTKDDIELAVLKEENGEIKLGGNAVCLLALVKYSELTGTDRYLQLLEKLALAILHMQDHVTGKFRHVLDFPSLSIKDTLSDYLL